MNLQKYHGLGNDYLIYDINQNNSELTKEQIIKICNRNFGVGSDGILSGPYIKDNRISVKIFNPDGSEAEKSGNGARIFAKYLKDANYIKENSFILSTLGGDIKINYLNSDGTKIKVSMGHLSFDSKDIGVIGNKREVVNEKMQFGNNIYTCTCVSIGNPHCVIPVNEVSKDLVCEIGKYSENASYFQNRINTQIVKIIDRNNIQIEIFERGAGYTLASGSSSCAAAGAVYKLGLVDSNITVHMPGGNLEIEIDKNYNVEMTGPVQDICSIKLKEEFC